MIALIDYRMLALPAVLLVPLALVPACAKPPAVEEVIEDDATSDPDATTKGKSDSGPSGEGGAGTEVDPTTVCPYVGPPLDVSVFEKCRDGGRCVPASQIPEKEQRRLAPCGTKGFCVAEKIVASYGNGLLKTCKSIGGGEGRCMSTVFPDIDLQKENIPQDVCDANERCTPCFHPLDGAPTGACSSIPFCDSPKTQPIVLPTCCTDSVGKDRGRCLPASDLPERAKSGLEQKECDSASLCAPAEQFKEGFVNPKCTASALLGKYDGACMSTCVKQDLLIWLGTSQGTCAAGSFCAPCKNPLDGKPTGAPGCDQP